MPLFTNIGGKLVEIKSLNTTNNGILKPIYGTPKENLTLHWGGFTGTSSLIQSDFLIGELNVDGSTYVSYNLTSTDNLNNLYTSVPSDLATQLGLSTDEFKNATKFRFKVIKCFKFKTEKTINKNKYFKSHVIEFYRTFTKNSNGNWEKTEDTFNRYNSIVIQQPTTFEENIFYVYVNNYAYIEATDVNGHGVGLQYLDFSQMNMNIEFTFQTLNNG